MDEIRYFPNGEAARKFVGFEVLPTVTVKITVIRAVTPRNSEEHTTSIFRVKL
jgi:hypothetical protein